MLSDENRNRKKITQLVQFLFEGEFLSAEFLNEISKKMSKHGRVLRVDHENVTETERERIRELTDGWTSDETASLLDAAMRVSVCVHRSETIDAIEELAMLFGKENPLHRKIDFWKNKIPASSSPEKVREILAKNGYSEAKICDFEQQLRGATEIDETKKEIFRQIFAFLVPIPESVGYEKLLLAQKMVRSHLDFEALLKNPNLIEGALYSAFLEFKKMYIEMYLDELEKYQTAVNKIHSQKNSIEKQLVAVRVLDEVPELGGRLNPNIFLELSRVFESHTPSKFSLHTVKKHLENHPQFQNFKLGTPLPDDDFSKFESELCRHLREKLRKIQSKTVKRVTAGGGNSAEKLCDLLHLAKIDEIVEILSGDGADDAIETIKKLVSEEK